MAVFITSDHAGFELKQQLVAHFQGSLWRLQDLGPETSSPIDYPESASALYSAMNSSPKSFGIAICGSGNGINMSMNRYPKIRSALCWNPEIAILAREHNDANVLALPARFLSIKEASTIVEAFLVTQTSTEERHQRRTALIDLLPFMAGRSETPNPHPTNDVSDLL